MAKQRQPTDQPTGDTSGPPTGPEAARRRCAVKMESAIGSARIEFDATDDQDARRQFMTWIERSLTVEWK